MKNECVIPLLLITEKQVFSASDGRTKITHDHSESGGHGENSIGFSGLFGSKKIPCFRRRAKKKMTVDGLRESILSKWLSRCCRRTNSAAEYIQSDFGCQFANPSFATKRINRLCSCVSINL